MAAPVVWADHSLTCRDGTNLVARVWQPAAGGSWPVLLMRQPYGRAIASTPVYAHPSWYASHGFMVVVQDVRGTGDSGGSFAGFAQEARDSAETVLWARSLPGSNGRLGTYGFSYQGLTQLLNDDPEGRPDALPDVLAPAMCGLAEAEHWSSSGGAHWWALLLGWGLQLAALQCRRRGDHGGWHAIARALASAERDSQGLALLQRLDPANPCLTWLQRDPSNAACWQRHRVDPELWRRPMLLIGGWSDPHLEGILDLYSCATAAGASPWLRVGAWTHLDWQGGVDAVQLAFFRQHLQQQQQAPPPLLLQCQSTRQWHAASPCQPRPGAESLRWGLASAGLAAIRSDEGALLPGQCGSGQVALVHDPWRPAPARGGHLGVVCGPAERSDLDRRSDVACFQTAVLTSGLLLFGRPVLRLQVRADQPGFDLVATLSSVAAGGAVQQLCMGVARHLGPGCEQSALRQVVLQPLLAHLEPGLRLRLSLAACAWPAIAVNPGDGTQPRGDVGPAHRVITLMLDLTEAELSIESMPIALIGPNCGQLNAPG